MSFLDNMGKALGGAFGGNATTGGQPDIMQIVQSLITQNGGLDGLLAKLQGGGLGDAVKSWLSDSHNVQITADQITQALGNPQIAAVAQQFGIDPQQVSAQLAQHLPEIIDKLSPGGILHANPQELLAQGASLLKGFLKS